MQCTLKITKHALGVNHDPARKKWLPIRYGGTKTCEFMPLRVIYVKLRIVRKFVKVWVAIINVRAPLHTKTTIQAYSSLIGLSSACVTGLHVVMQHKFTYALELNIRGKRKEWDIMWRSTFFTITTAKQTCGTTRSVSSTVQNQSWNMISMLSRRLLRSPLSADVSGAALAAVAAAALRIAAHKVWHLAFTFLLVMEFHLSFSSSPLLHGSLCLRCTKHNGEKRWLWNSCFMFLLPSNCLRSVVKESWLLPLRWLSVLCSLTGIIDYWHFVCSSPSC